MDRAERYPYLDVSDSLGRSLPRPLLPIGLQNRKLLISVHGLLDTGATVNILPYETGLELGFSWEQQTRSTELAGNLGQYEARGVIAMSLVSEFQPIPLIFAWTCAQGVPLLLGQVNFFAEFDVCFFQTQRIFEISLKSAG